ncbi:DUF4190 domain-containing protein [Pseudokineococcus basanitobsidens]|uniref:DUF4190 domain-containing protein n=1 Tax=Pseudokineococcus basanitobsidens TaxID=1926649 RepID=A0ABU8RF08_9ACTN
MIDAPTTPPQAQHQRKGLAIAALVLGLVAILGCLVPVLNIGSIVIGVVGLALGVTALLLARRATHGGRGMAIAGTVLSTLAIIGAVIVNLVLGAAINAADDAITDAENGYSDISPEEEDAAEEATLPLGEATEVGEYTVAVTAVNPDADDVIAAENEFNEAPTGQYVLVDVDVTYNGDEEGDPWIDLTAGYQGTDSRDYDESSCTAVTPAEASDQPTLRNGGSASYSVCFDLPADAIEGGRVSMEETLSLTSEPSYWSAQ